MSLQHWVMPQATPRRYAVLLYRQWESIDVMGPAEALNTLSRNSTDQFIMDIITPNFQPSSTAPATGQGSLVNQQLVPTHGYHFDSKNPTADLLQGIPAADVLIVPGGLGPTEDELPGVVEFIRQYYTRYLQGWKNKYLFTVCTGSRLAAMAHCLDGHYATTNKVAWNWVTGNAASGKTYWVAHSRWVDDGSIWTTSGVSAGTDGMIAFIRKIYGADKDGVEFAKKVADGMEWITATSQFDDPFSKGLNDVPNGMPPPPWEKSQAQKN